MNQEIAEEISEYNKLAESFLKDTNTTMETKFLGNMKHFTDDIESRDVYEITFKRGNREFKVRFGQSLVCSGKYIVFSRGGKRVYNDLELARKEFLKSDKYHLSRGEYKENDKFEVPSAYDLLACIQKYDIGSFEDFCDDFGYDSDSRKAFKIYVVCLDEWNNVQKLWTEEEIEKLREIQ